ncbi:MAG: hypothetical protein ACO1TE_07680 [Prosthecobacter sp.]
MRPCLLVLLLGLPGCSLITVPLGAAGTVAGATVKATGGVAKAGIGAMGSHRQPAPQQQQQVQQPYYPPQGYPQQQAYYPPQQGYPQQPYAPYYPQQPQAYPQQQYYPPPQQQAPQGQWYQGRWYPYYPQQPAR